MNLLDLVHRTPVPKPWAEGEKIPWQDPDFSQRMLKEHMSQDHDAASRRLTKIDAHVDWIHRTLLSARPARVLDLGCGPGLYCSRLARLGHTCVGIDFGPASIAYATEAARREGLRCTYRQHDIRSAEYGTGFDLAMLIFGEMNVFSPVDIRLVLRKAYQALDDGGVLLLEPQRYEDVRQEGQNGSSWYTTESGLFSALPHLYLTEYFWDSESHTTTIRYLIVDAESGEVTRHASTTQAYSGDEFRSLLAECGFAGATFYPSLTGTVDETQSGFLALVAVKPAARP